MLQHQTEELVRWGHESSSCPHLVSTEDLALDVGVAGNLALSLSCWAAVQMSKSCPPPIYHLPLTIYGWQ